MADDPNNPPQVLGPQPNIQQLPNVGPTAQQTLQGMPQMGQQQADPSDAIQQGLNSSAKFYQQQIDKATQSRGQVRSMLQNFFSGMAQEMGVTTPYQKAQSAAVGLQNVANAQGMLALHQQMAANYAPVPLVGMDGKPILDPTTNKPITLPAAHAQTFYAGQAVAASRVQAAGITGAAGIEKAQINQGMMMPVTEEMRQALGLPEGTTQIPLRQLNQAVSAATRPLTTVQGASDQYQVNRLTQDKTALGVGNPRIAAVEERARLTPFETVEPGTNTPVTISALQALQTGAPRVPLGQATALGGKYAQFNDAYGILDNIDRMVGTGPGQVNFTDPDVRARVAAGYAAIKDPASNGLAGEVLSNFLARQPIGASLKENERALVLQMAQGKAAATGLRGILGQAGSNEMQQRLDAGLFPGGQAVGSNEAVKQQTQATRGLLDRFVVGQPQVGLNAPGQASALSNKTAAAKSAASGSVRVQLPDGRTGTIPASSLQKYQQMGAKILQ